MSAFHSVCSTCSLLSEEEDEASTEELEVDVWVVSVVLEDSDEVEVSAVSVLAAVDLLSVLVVVVVATVAFAVSFVDSFFDSFPLVQPANKKARPIVTKILFFN